MKRNLISLIAAAAAVVPAAAMALDTPTAALYGNLNLSMDLFGASGGNSAAGAAVTNNRFRIASNSSYLGVKGSEEISPDYSAIFQLETGLGTSIIDSVNVFSRNTGVGMKGPWGQVMLDQWDTPLKVLHSSAEPFYGATSAELSNLLDSPGFGVTATTSADEGANNTTVAGSGVTTGSAVSSTSANTLAWNRRQSNSIQYWNTFGAFQLKLMYGNGSISQPSRDMYSGSLMFQDMGLTAGIAYEGHNNFRVGNTTLSPLLGESAGTLTNDSTRDTNLKAILGYSIESTGTSIYGVMSSQAYNDFFAGTYAGTGTAPAYGATSSYSKMAFGGTLMQKLGNFTPKVSFMSAGEGSTTLADGTTTSTSGYGASQIMVGTSYAYSKRTEAYIFATRLMNGANATYTVAVNGPIFNNGATNSTSPAKGENIDVISLGIKHVF